MSCTDILIVGSGAREHALAWKLRASSGVGAIYLAPGNAGTVEVAENVPIAAMDLAALADFAEAKKIGLTVVGPDNPLASGIVDRFRDRGLVIFGPTKEAARLESSKAHAKSFMALQGIPTARFRVFGAHEKALEYIRANGAPVVVKASGLALGKGVFVCRTVAEAEDALRKIMVERAFKEAGDRVVIEDFLEGAEYSVHAVTDGRSHFLLPLARDYKRLLDGDRGPNTGGMGSVVGLPDESLDLRLTIGSRVIEPALRGMRSLGTPFTGCLYPGIIVTESGPKVLEFNARFGDPETQSLMRVIRTGDLLRLLLGASGGEFPADIPADERLHAVCVVLAAEGYPDSPKKGSRIVGIDAARSVPGVEIFHAGTSLVRGELLATGGRVLSVTATGYSRVEARNRAYQAAGLIRFDGMQYRRDIAS